MTGKGEVFALEFVYAAKYRVESTESLDKFMAMLDEIISRAEKK